VGTKWVPRAVPTRYPRPDLRSHLPVGLDAGIGPTARPRPIAVADSPIEAAPPDPQHPLCYLYYSSHGGLRVTSHHWHSSTPGQLPDRPVGLGRRADAGFRRTARPLPITVADSPIEAATPDPQHPMCYLSRC
jgi:hypothetical protein